MSIISLTSSDPLIGLVHDLIRLVAKKNVVEYELNLFYIIPPCRFLVLLEIITSSFGELDFWFVHRSFSIHKTQSEKS